ncbi:MAG: hypothetical protein Q7S14_00545 [bacterium]|nr:hypothetical protein [bacterium]
MEINVSGNIDVSSLKNNLVEENLLGLKNALIKTLGENKTDVAIVAKTGNIIYLAVCGKGKIKIKRNNKEINVLESLTGEITRASGKNNNENFILEIPTETKEVSFFKTSWLEKIMPKKDLYLRPQNLGIVLPGQVKSHRQLIITIAILLLVAWAIFRQVSYRLENDVGVKLDKAIVKSEEKIKEAQNLVSVNRPLAREMLETERKIYESNNLSKAKEFVVKIDGEINKMMQRNFSEPTLYYDFSLIKDGASSGPAVLISGKLFFLDQNSGTLLSLDVKSKSTQVVAADEKFKSGKFLSVYTGKMYIFTNNGVFNDKKVLVIKPDPKWQEIIAMESFGGNIYLLDKKSNQIWKHISTESGFTDAKPYLNADTKADFSKAVAMGIDGSVYVLQSSGELLKFTQGRPEVLNLTGADKPIIFGGGLAVSDSLKNIYLYDSQNNRVVVFGPDGLYLSQYLISGNYSSIFVDETLQKIFLLNGAKVYSVELN